MSPAPAAVTSTPRMMSKYTGLVTSDTSSATVALRPAGTARAGGSVRYPNRAAAARIRSPVAWLTRPGRENARDTVDGATPHSRAMS